MIADIFEKEGGIKGFYKGISLNVIKAPLSLATVWTVKNYLNRILDKGYDFWLCMNSCFFWSSGYNFDRDYQTILWYHSQSSFLQMGQFGLIFVHPSIHVWWKIWDGAQGKMLISSPVAKSWKQMAHSEHFDKVSEVTRTLSGSLAFFILFLQQHIYRQNKTTITGMRHIIIKIVKILGFMITSEISTIYRRLCWI